MKTLLDFFKFNSETKRIEEITFKSLTKLNKKSKRNKNQEDFEKTLKLIGFF